MYCQSQNPIKNSECRFDTWVQQCIYHNLKGRVHKKGLNLRYLKHVQPGRWCRRIHRYMLYSWREYCTKCKLKELHGCRSHNLQHNHYRLNYCMRCRWLHRVWGNLEEVDSILMSDGQHCLVPVILPIVSTSIRYCTHHKLHSCSQTWHRSSLRPKSIRL